MEDLSRNGGADEPARQPLVVAVALDRGAPVFGTA